MSGERRRLALRGALALLLLVALQLRAAEPQAPAFELRDRILTVSALPAILGRPEIRPHLTTGLTTTLLVQVRAVDGAGHHARGGARIDVRYELWDEVFLVTAMGVDGRAHRESLPSFERLLAWWAALNLPAVATDSLVAHGPWRIEARLSALPFSQSEQRDTQRWLTDSIERRSDTPPSPSGTPGAAGRAEPLTGALDALIATSIKRQQLVDYDWTVVFQPERRR
jgi:hypothetical protein